MLSVINIIRHKNAGLRILDMGGSTWDISDPAGEAVLDALGAISEFERTLMLERQREGIAAAKAQGKYKGRAPTARLKTPDVQALRLQGIGPAEIANRLEISRASVHRILRSPTQ